MKSGSSAGFGRRFAALVYDSLLLIALLMIFTAVVMAARHALFVTQGDAIEPKTVGSWFYLYQAGLIGVIAAYYVANWVRSGQTLGMRAWHLRAVTESGTRLGVAAALLRFVCGFLAWLPLALGVLWLYFDPDHLAVHDRLSKTRVVHLARSRI